MRLLVVIVNYRSADLAVDCLRTLLPELAAFPEARVIVTDNLSPDDSLTQLQKAIERNQWCDRVTLMPLPKNGGFAYGNNAAIAPALSAPEKPDCILLLNPDTVIRPGAISALVDFMTAHPAVGIAGSRLEDPDGTPQRSAFRFHSPAGEFESAAKLGLASRLLSRQKTARPVSDVPVRCDWVAGASMIVRRAVFEKIGLMDERYFMYFEEVDFCLKAARAEFECWYVPASRVVHLVGSISQLSDSRKHRKRRPDYWFESRRRFFVTNFSGVYAAMADLGFLAGNFLYQLRRTFTRQPDGNPVNFLTDSFRHSVFVKGFKP